jgi:hypothetical protein
MRDGRFIRGFLGVAIFGLLVGAAVHSSAQTPAKTTAVPEDLQERQKQLDKSPLIFYVARGELDTCGKGCDTWIAVEGQFDLGSAERFRQFITRHAKPKRPIFFSFDRRARRRGTRDRQDLASGSIRNRSWIRHSQRMRCDQAGWSDCRKVKT